MKLFRTLLATLFVFPVATAQAQSYPAKALRWIMPYPPGGSFDAATRAVATHLSIGLGQPIVIENRVGAAGIIGTEAAVKSAADGYTLVSADNGTLVYNTMLYKTLPYDPVRDLLPVSLFGRVPLFVTAGEGTGLKSLGQLIESARAKPGKITYASSGTGSPQHLAMELLKSRARIDLVHVPYKGAGLVMQDFLAGRVDVAMLTLGNLGAQSAAGKVRALASTDTKRLAALPDIPTVAEAGLAGYSAPVLWAMAVPAGTPADIVTRLNQELRKALATPEVIKRMADLGAEPAASSPEETLEILRQERAIWGPLISSLGIVLN